MSRLIDADMLKSAIARYSEKLLSHKNLSIVKNAIREVLGDINFAIDIQPTIDAVPVEHGKWIWSDDLCEYCCSRCGHTDDYGIHPDIEYCPYCGALMDQVVVDE